MAPMPALVALVIVLFSGCTSVFSPSRPRLHALLVNGGGSQTTNFSSHVRQLEKLHALLSKRGVAPNAISVFASDGRSPAPDFVVSRTANEAEAWLLEATLLERLFLHPTRLENTESTAQFVAPATGAHLRSWFRSAGDRLRSDDTLFVFVTDHGEKGQTPMETRITLWNRESVTVAELSWLIDHIPAGVRVVVLMSQCYSGAFAEIALRPSPKRPVGSTCGYFSAPAHLPAFGCSPDEGSDRGHAFEFIAALERDGSLSAAHEEVLLMDLMPDVPVRTSDLFAARHLERVAVERGSTPEELVSSLVSDALSAYPVESARLRRIAAFFSLPLSLSGSSLRATVERAKSLKNTFRAAVASWHAAIGQQNQANLDAFLASKPSWSDLIRPTEVVSLSFDEVERRRQRLLAEMGAFLRHDPGVLEKVHRAWNNSARAQTALSRSEVRLAVLARLQTSLFALVGRYLLSLGDSPGRADAFEALRDCENLHLPNRSDDTVALRDPSASPFPGMAQDEGLAKDVVPGSFGMRLAELPTDSLARQNLPGGAAWVVSVDPGSSGSAAGILPGDIVLGGVDEPARHRGEMGIYLASWIPGNTGELQILREGKTLTLNLTAEPPRIDRYQTLSAAQRSSLGRLTRFSGSPSAASAGKSRLLFFWATWCAPCKKAIPSLLQMERDQGLKVLAITNEPPKVVRRFLSRRKAGFPDAVAIDAHGWSLSAFSVDRYPTFIFIDGQDRIRKIEVGFQAETRLPESSLEWQFFPRMAPTDRLQ